MQAIKDRAASLAGLALERDAIFLYDALARIEKDPARRSAFERIATSERRHAAIWEAKLLSLGEQVPATKRPSWRVRQITLLARLFGTRAVSDMVKALEGYEEEVYGAHGDVPEVTDIAADEAKHADIWRELDGEKSGGAHRAALAETKAREPWHRSGSSGTLRATIFGVSDGLVSNAALVMGIAGATTASGQGGFVVLAGIAGLLAGAFSMAAGEYVSMRSQTELLERQIELERAELEAMPEEEEAEIAGIYRARGFPEEEARSIAQRLMSNPSVALETLVREELGLDPEELGSPWGAAAGSFIAFAIGAFLPLLPFILLTGSTALLASIAVTAIALFSVGAAVSLLTGKSAIYTGLRQLAIGAAAAAITYAVGSLIGVNV
ncbi:MAG: hypothetical protein EBR48_00320 [bacterium]|nr:hypothetical protein [Candidatus Aquidulcis frankliniae]